MDQDLGLSFDLPADAPASAQAEYYRQYQQQAMAQPAAAASMAPAGVAQQSVQGIPQQMPNGPMMPPSMAAGASGAGAVGAEVAGFDDDELGMFMDTETPNDFEFGLIDNSLLLAMALAGATLDPILEKKLGVRGYGMILGAVLGNAIANSLGASDQGTKSMLTVFAGALAPVVPVAIALGMKKDLSGTTRNVLLGTSVVALGYGVASRTYRRRRK